MLNTGAVVVTWLSSTAVRILNVDEPQALKSKEWVDAFDNRGQPGDEGGLAPRRDHLGRAAELCDHPLHHALDLGDEAPDQARLDRGHRVAPDDRIRRH